MSEPQTPGHGAWAWHELATRDPERAVAFFCDLLGWTSHSVDMGPGVGRYHLFRRPGSEEDIGGVMAMAGPQWEGMAPHWMVYIEVDDVDARIARTTELGGQVAVPPFDVPGVGRMAVIADPTGAYISLMTPAARQS